MLHDRHDTLLNRYAAVELDFGGIGGAAYSLFNKAGFAFVALAVGTQRASGIRLRNRRIEWGAFFMIGTIAGLAIALIYVGDPGATFEWRTAFKAFFVSFLFCGMGGVFVGWSLIAYVERVRDAAVRSLWVADVDDDFTRAMETSIDELTPIDRGYYYDEYFAARDRGQLPAEAHATGHRRRGSLFGFRNNATSQTTVSRQPRSS